MAPQIIWLGGYFVSKRLSSDRIMCMWRGTNCCMMHSSDDIWQNPVSFSSSVVSDVAFVLRRLETVLERIALPFKRKIAQVFLHELFGEHSTFCLIDWSSLGVVFRGLSDLFLS